MISDTLFTLIRVAGDGPINQFDKVSIRTRHGYWLNAWDSRGGALRRSERTPTWRVSDTIFEIQLDPQTL